MASTKRHSWGTGTRNDSTLPSPSASNQLKQYFSFHADPQQGRRHHLLRRHWLPAHPASPRAEEQVGHCSAYHPQRWNRIPPLTQQPGVSITKAEYPHSEQQTSYQEMRKPFDKQSATVAGTSIHPHSQIKPVQRQYRMDGSSGQEQRDIRMYGSDFKSTLPQHPQA
jgi:hypothetical protein